MSRESGWRRQAIALVVATLATVVGVWLVLRAGLNHDVGWYLRIAERVLSGERLYVDVIDVNPPLVVWQLIPLVTALKAAGLPVVLAPTILVAVEFALCAALAIAVLRAAAMSLSSQAWLVAALAVVGLWTPGFDVGQREHQLVLLSVPALLLLALDLRGTNFPPWQRVAAGVLAGVGISFKPHFVVAWFALQLLVAADRRSLRLAIRTDNVMAVVVVFLYFVAAVVFAPEYGNFVRDWGAVYLAAFNQPWWKLVVNLSATIAVGVVILAWLAPARHGWGSVQSAMAVAAALFALVAIAQRKGWTYHWYPAFAYGTLSLVAIVLRWATVRPRYGTRFVYGGVTVLLVGTFALEGAWRTGAGLLGGDLRRRFTAELQQVLTLHGGTQSVVVLSDDMALLFPAVNQLELPWLSRFPSLWVLPLVYSDGCGHAGDPAGLAMRFEARMREDIWNDAVSVMPTVILDDTRVNNLPHASRCRSVSEFLAARDRRFSRVFAGYVPADTLGDYVVLVRASLQK